MAFTPIALPIQELLLTNFVTDIASITNANTQLLQAKLEDLINNFEIDTNGVTIGTDTPIVSLKSNRVILVETGFTFETAAPASTQIASLVKNGLGKSVLTIDELVVNDTTNLNAITVDSLTANSTSNLNGGVVINSKLTIANSVSESKESLVCNITRVGAAASATGIINLSSTSRQNIFTTLSVTAAPTANPVYDGASISSGITALEIYLDFDSVSPPEENTVFTINLVDIVEANLQTSIKTAIQTAGLQIRFIGGLNNSITPTPTTILLHDNSSALGIPDSSNFEPFRASISFMYIKDASLNDRILVKSLVGAELF